MDIRQKLDIVLISVFSLLGILALINIILVFVLMHKRKESNNRFQKDIYKLDIERTWLTVAEFTAPMIAMLIYKWIFWG